MEYMKLGLTDLEISRVGFGCWAIGGHGWGNVDDSLSIAAIREAYNLGINFFDTADVYGFGHSEEILSRALGEYRHEVIIATKFGVSWDADGNIGRNSSAKYISAAVGASLKRLNIDCIPLYQIHWPDYDTPIMETMEALRRCQEEGKIRYIGCSNFSSKLIRNAQKYGRLESLQVPLSIIRNNIKDECLTCRELNMGIIVYDVLVKGLLSGKFQSDAKFNADDIRSLDKNFQGIKFKKNLELVKKMKEIGAGYGKTVSQVAIRWALDNPSITCAITGIKKPEQIRENIEALNWKLAKEDWKLLSESGN